MFLKHSLPEFNSKNFLEPKIVIIIIIIVIIIIITFISVINLVF